MARALGKNDPDKITRLHQILNDGGSFAHLASYVKKEGVPSGNLQAALKNLAKSLRQIIEFVDQLDWQSNESIAAGYAKGRPVFTASADRISAEFYSQRDRAVAEMRRYAEAVAFAEARVNTSRKSRLGIEIRQTKYIIEAYEEFTGKPISGERSNKRENPVREFLELGVNHITEGSLTVGQIGYVIRQAAEMVRKQRKITSGGNHPPSGG